jgi:hypothetical protein
MVVSILVQVLSNVNQKTVSKKQSFTCDLDHIPQAVHSIPYSTDVPTRRRNIMNSTKQRLILSQETLRSLVEDPSTSMNTTLPVCPTGFVPGKDVC